jgi:hypothetical protein
MRIVRASILLALCTLAVNCKAQQSSEGVVYSKRKEGDAISIQTIGGACKSKRLVYKKNNIVPVYFDRYIPKQNEDFLSIRGNILYNFNYRSYIDTPFQQSDMMQHTVQTYIDGDLEGKVPFRAVFTYRGSNSPYFSNTSDVSVQYRQSDMLEKIKSDLRKDADSSVDMNLLVNPSHRYNMPKGYWDSLRRSENPFRKDLYKNYDSLYEVYAAKRKLLDSLQQANGNKNWTQALVEAREAKLFGKYKSNTDSSLIKDSAAFIKWASSDIGLAKGENQSDLSQDNTVSKTIDTSEAKIKYTRDSINALRKEVAKDEKAIMLFQKKMTDSVNEVKQNIGKLNSPQAVKDYISSNDTLENSRLSKAQKIFLSINQIGIGRTWLNYSELTVSNVSLNGFNIEANPGKYYMAGAIGSVNSQFRDFILNNNTSRDQSVKLVRFGLGRINKDNIILTVYAGQKGLINTAGVGDSAATEPIMGVSLSATKVITKNTSITAEYARSSYQDVYDSVVQDKGKGLFARVVNFKMHANDALALGFKSNYPETHTKIDGEYREMGEAFQSFTIYATGIKQNAYNLNVNQVLWKKKLIIDASVKKNEFNSPLTAPGYANTAVFKSIQITLTIPKYPFVSVGYYPSSQLFVGTNNIIYQSWYNTLNAISSYSYKAAKQSMMTSLTYTKFYNHQSDSGFVYYNASTFSGTQTVYLSPFTLMATCTITHQDSLNLTTLEPQVSWQYKKVLTLTAGVSYSRLNSSQTLWGGTAGMGILINHIGTIQLHYDKVYLPAYKGGLMPVDLGRITYNKVF